MRVLIADDDAIVCQSLATILGAQDDVDVLSTCTSADEAVRQYAKLMPDIVLLDIRMPERDGISAAHEILSTDGAARIVFLTTFSDDEYIRSALALGARGYLIKQDVQKIAPALRSVMQGQCVLEGEVLERATSYSSEQTLHIDALALAALTEREREVSLLVAEGLSNVAIAQRLFLSEGTVRNHISSALTKLDLDNRTQLAIYIFRHSHL